MLLTEDQTDGRLVGRMLQPVMVEKKVDVEMLIADIEAILTTDEGEALPQFEQELPQMPYKARLKFAFAVAKIPPDRDIPCRTLSCYAYDNQSRRVATIHVKPDLTEMILEQSSYTPTGRFSYVVQTLSTESDPESLLTEYTYDTVVGKRQGFGGASARRRPEASAEEGNKLTQTDALDRTTAWEYD